MTEIRPLVEEELDLLKYLPFSHPDTHRRRFGLQKRGKLVFLIAWQSRIPVGQVLLQWQGGDNAAIQPKPRPYPEIASLFVAPEYRLKGIATQLIDTAEAIARQRGYTHIGLCVATDNGSARSLYKRLQYKDAGRGEYRARGISINRDGSQQTWEEIRIYLTKALHQPECWTS
ncbi:MAG: GNAT family N-acetyltransferase [bacterium]|nr:GNAT family N-acetyltransferase [bacterium]